MQEKLENIFLYIFNNQNKQMFVNQNWYILYLLNGYAFSRKNFVEILNFDMFHINYSRNVSIIQINVKCKNHQKMKKKMLYYLNYLMSE